MTLWNIIRNFFVQYIFGGLTSDNVLYHGNMVGYLYNQDLDNTYVGNTDFYVNVGDIVIDADYQVQGINYLTLGDWLSTTFTIITLIAICFFLFLVVRWLFRLTAGLIQGRG